MANVESGEPFREMGRTTTTGRVLLPTLIVLVALLLVAVTVLLTLYISDSRASESAVLPQASPVSSSPSPSPSASPDGGAPGRAELEVESLGGVLRPALQAQYFNCDPLSLGASAFYFTTLEISADLETLVIDGVDDSEVISRVAAGVATSDEYLDAHQCVLAGLGAPPGIIERMERTRALDGTASEEWPGYKVTWSYHPDSGLDAVVSYVD